MTQQQPSTCELKEAYRLAIAARDLEINQLIQRNNFFMVFQGVLLAGLIQGVGNGRAVPVVAFLVCLTGLLISVLQILMAAGAKFWQERWEYAVETIENEVFPNPYPATNAEIFRVFSNPRDRTNEIVESRMRGKWLGCLVSRRFSPSRLPIWTAIAFSVVWLLLLLCTVHFTFQVPSWIAGFSR